jgi:hypothetical protein
MSLPPGNDLDDEEISLRPYIQTVWRYRQVIVTATIAAAVVFGVVTLGLFAVSPPDRVASLQFRLAWPDADKGRYPNGTPFNATEIAAEPVVSQVFTANSLDRYVSLEELQQSLSVVKSSPAVRRLDAELQAALSNTRLTVADRVRLEANYQANREAVQDPQFDLLLHRNGRLMDIPAPLIDSLLSDVLETWAMQADAKTGVTRPAIDTVSRGMFARAADKSESYLMRVEVMREGAQRLLAVLNALQEIPGARAVRSADNRSLADEVAAVQEFVSIDLETLIGLIRLAPVSPRERVVLNAYLAQQIVTARLNLNAASARARNLQTVLREYMAQREDRFDIRSPVVQPAAPGAGAAAAPGLSESFVKEMVTLAAAAQDREFEYRRVLTQAFVTASAQATEATRQISYYQDLLSHLSTASAPNDAVTADVSSRFTAVYDRLMEAVDRVEELNQAVSAQVLNPARRLYSVTTPVRLQTAPSISMRLLLIRFALTVIVTLIVASAVCLAYSSRSAAMVNSADKPSFEART